MMASAEEKKGESARIAEGYAYNAIYSLIPPSLNPSDRLFFFLRLLLLRSSPPFTLQPCVHDIYFNGAAAS